MSKIFRFLILPLAVLIVLAFAYFWLMLNWSFSAGERAGSVLKISKKGWLCKTWEGELQLLAQPGTVAEKFEFTIRDPKIAEEAGRLSGRRVNLIYEQHKGLYFSCFGDTEYFVTQIKLVDDAPAAPAAALPAAPAATTNNPPVAPSKPAGSP